MLLPPSPIKRKRAARTHYHPQRRARPKRMGPSYRLRTFCSPMCPRSRKKSWYVAVSHLVFTPSTNISSRQDLFLSNAPADHEKAREMISELLTQHRGEYVLRIGQQPSHTILYAGALTDASDGWTGLERTEQDLDVFKERIIKTVEDVGGKVGRPSFVFFIARSVERRGRLLFCSRRGPAIHGYRYY